MFSVGFRRTTNKVVNRHLRFVSKYFRHRDKPAPVNTIINFVPQQEAWVIERFGKFSRVLDPGLAILIPVVEEIKYTQSLKEVAIEVPSQSAITLDNVTLQLDGVLYYRVEDPYQASYGVEDCEYAVTQLAQTTMRSELGKITLDKIFQERTSLNANIVNAISEAASAWGIKCLRYEIRDIQLPNKVKEAMQMQVEAERKKRAAILESEGKKVSAINVAEGEKQSKILSSEGQKLEKINLATGEANAILAKANARAEAILKVAQSLSLESGNNAAALTVAEQYVQAFGNLAKTSNTVVLPANTGDAASMVAQGQPFRDAADTNGGKIKRGKKAIRGDKDGVLVELFSRFQAMAVYGQVSKPTSPSYPPSDDDPSNKGTKMHSGNLAPPPPSGSRADNLFVDQHESNAGLKMTSQEHSVSDSTWQQVPPLSQESHFSAASSPTRKRDFL